MNLSDFNYYLPKELIAQYPLKRRDQARLLILNRKKRSIKHSIFKEITGYFQKSDLLVLNDTKVLPSRVKGCRLTGGKVEFLLLRKKSGSTFETLIRPNRVKIGEKVIFGGAKACGIISARNEIKFNLKDKESVYRLGVMPLPPYIKREAEKSDSIYYQTVYAKKEGAVASPTAGLHFTKKLLEDIKARGINSAYITLHVGPATFLPIKCEDVTKHKMEPEYFRIPQSSAKAIKKAKKDKSRIIAVGTTSLRALETYAQGAKKGYTGLFIYPGYKFRLADCLLTNFHLPKTTLFMLVCAFAGEELIKKAYQEAIENKYRFYSYGDAMLIL